MSLVQAALTAAVSQAVDRAIVRLTLSRVNQAALYFPKCVTVSFFLLFGLFVIFFFFLALG